MKPTIAQHAASGTMSRTSTAFRALLCGLVLWLGFSEQMFAESETTDQQVGRFFAAYCTECHGAKKAKAKVTLHDFTLAHSSAEKLELWERVIDALKGGSKGVTHDIAHKRPEVISGQWDRWRAQQHAYFLQRLRDTPEGEGNMLDRTLVLWASAHPHASHSNQNYPLLLAGGNHVDFKHGLLHSFEDTKQVTLEPLRFHAASCGRAR